MVDKNTLDNTMLATGIDIQNKKMIFTADNSIFRNNSGQQIAMFENNKFKADLIDAEKIVTRKLLTTDSGKRIEVDPSTNAIKLYDERNHLIVNVGFWQESAGSLSSPSIDLYTYDFSGNALSDLRLRAGSIYMSQDVIINGVIDTRIAQLTPSGLVFINNKGTMTYPSK